MSPFLVQTSLSLLYCGATGKTAATMQSVLQLGTDLTREDVANNFYYLLLPFKNNRLVNVANGIFVNNEYELLTAYESIADQQFFTTVSIVNFTENVAAAQTINNYVSGQTNGQITNLISSTNLSADTGMVAVNAIDFNGDWISKFPKSKTVSGTKFYTSITTSRLVDMMHTSVNIFGGKENYSDGIIELNL